MKPLYTLCSLAVSAFTAFVPASAQNAEPSYEIIGRDTICQIFLYSPGPADGLHVAYLDDRQQWRDAGQLCGSDYGPWGKEKKMYAPCVAKAADGTWRLLFSVNDHAPCLAASYSEDLMTWRPQDYPRMSVKGCMEPVMFLNDKNGFDVYFRTKQGPRFTTASSDFRHFSADEPSTIEDLAWLRDTATVDGKVRDGNLFEVPKLQVDYILHHFAALANDSRLCGERMAQDDERFRSLGNVTATLTVDATKRKAISDKLIGVFFEDINHAADGGLYAELVQNRDFEYNDSDYDRWNATTAWTLFDADTLSPLHVATDYPLSKNNPHYLVIDRKAVANGGFDGIYVKPDSIYDFSFYARLMTEGAKRKRFEVQLVADGGEVLASGKLDVDAASWKCYRLALRPELPKFLRQEGGRGPQFVNVLLVLAPKDDDTQVAVDMVSLFPRDTYKDHGLRRDLAEAIAALHPKFVRFPGGCLSHGNGIGNIYHWNQTIGPLQDRKPDRNIWNCHQTRGLGFEEYFRFCDDIGAEPLPVLSAGVPCQNSEADTAGYAGQQGGIPFHDPQHPDVYDMDDYTKEVLDMIAWARKNFRLNYIGIGNEDLISTAFEERYLMICRAIKAQYPDITIIGTAGPFHYPSADYVEGWKLAKANSNIIGMVDEHYYENPGWFLHHQDYYDDYDRRGPKVYIGEYASKTRNMESALVEAIHLCNVERNGDVVAMMSYAPLLCNEKHTNWNPNLIYFDNTTVTLTPSYESQRLFSTHGGDEYVTSQLKISDSAVAYRVAASVVADSKSGRNFIKIVNALPRDVTLNVEGIAIPDGSKAVSFYGQPSADTVQSEETSVNGSTLVLKPYSVTAVTIY